MHTGAFRDSQVFSDARYTGKKKQNKKTSDKKCSIILALMLWSQNTDTFLFCLHFLLLLLRKFPVIVHPEHSSTEQKKQKTTQNKKVGVL